MKTQNKTFVFVVPLWFKAERRVLDRWRSQ